MEDLVKGYESAVIIQNIIGIEYLLKSFDIEVTMENETEKETETDSD